MSKEMYFRISSECKPKTPHSHRFSGKQAGISGANLVYPEILNKQFQSKSSKFRAGSLTPKYTNP